MLLLHEHARPHTNQQRPRSALHLGGKVCGICGMEASKGRQRGGSEGSPSRPARVRPRGAAPGRGKQAAGGERGESTQSTPSWCTHGTHGGKHACKTTVPQLMHALGRT